MTYYENLFYIRYCSGRATFQAYFSYHFTREDPEDKKIIIQMISETDPTFIKWGIQAVLKWRNEQTPASLYHLHGTRDEMFPYGCTSPTHTILKGDHVIVITRHKEVNNILAEIFSAII